MSRRPIWFAPVLALAFGLGVASVAHADAPASSGPAAARPPVAAVSDDGASALPFGANLFTGAFVAQRQEGLNPDYRILPGDRVAVNVWGTVALNDVLTVDTQGNVFLPGIGPIRVAGVRNADLTSTVRTAIGRVYRGGYEVYTNLLTSSPVAVFVTGGVARPGRYAGIPSDSVLYFLDQAGGIDPEQGSYRDIVVRRGDQELARLDLYEFLVQGRLGTPQLADGDVVVVGRRGAVVEVRGVLPRPVLLEFPAAPVRGEELFRFVTPHARANEVILEGVRDGRSVAQALPLATFRGRSVLGGDVVTVRSDYRSEQVTVRLEGEHLGASVLTLRRGARLLDALNLVPVNPELAQPEAVHIRRPRVARDQQRAIQEGLDRLERSALLALSETEGEAGIRVREAELVRHFVESARTIQPLGRVVTAAGGRQMNVVLEDGDTVVIPARTNVIRVGGEVLAPNAVMFRPGLTIEDYVEQAGGYTDRAETGDVLVVRANGEVSLRDTDGAVGPGDEVLVLPHVDHKVFQNALDVSTLIYQIAVAASVLIAL